ncbi:MAG: methionyl-tRNA formyltransferase [Actinomycetes bacterium]
MRIVYLGTPADAVPPLEAVVAAGHEVALVVTQPDRRRSRGTGTTPSPVRAAAEALGLPVVSPERVREVVDAVAALDADLGVVVAFGQILPTALLEAIPGGFVNLHFSLLPRWRGAAPVERAILDGDAETGVAVMAVVPELDAGGTFAVERTPIAAEETAGELRDRLVDLGARLLVRTLPTLDGRAPDEQFGDPTYASKLTVAEFELDPAAPAPITDRLVRAGNPRPGAWLVHDGVRLKVWRGRVEGERYVPTEVQPENRPRMTYEAWLAGHRGARPW